MSSGSGVGVMPGSRSRSTRHTTDLDAADSPSASSSPYPSPRPRKSSAAGYSGHKGDLAEQSGENIGDAVLLEGASAQQQQQGHDDEKMYSESGGDSIGNTGQVALLGLIKSFSLRFKDDGVSVSTSGSPRLIKSLSIMRQ
jgi:hypothetical protein